MLDWSEKVSKKYVSKELSQEIHNRAGPFISWLKEAEEESESESEDDVEVRNASHEGLILKNFRFMRYFPSNFRSNMTTVPKLLH